jgi:hypothetical protein
MEAFNNKYKALCFDNLVKSPKAPFPVIPAKAGSSPGQAPESRVSRESGNPDFL